MSTRTTAQLSRYGEVVVSLLPAAERPAPPEPPPGASAAKPTPSRYDAWIYTKLALPVRLGAATATGAAPRAEIGGLPLVGREEIGVRWRGYGEILSTLHEGEDAIVNLRRRVVRGISGGLQHLLGLRPREPGRLRIWWSCDQPELEALPWEVIALGRSRPPNLSFVRGGPVESVPPVRLAPEAPLRVAIIDPACATPAALCEALDGLGREIEIRWIEGKNAREALHETSRAGMDVVHVIADGSTPLGLEGLLEIPGEDEGPLSPIEFRTLLLGARAPILVLTPPEVPRIDRSGLPAVFHAFARLARGIDPGPTIVAQIGPMPPRAARDFWSVFYRRLATSLDVEEAAASAAETPAKAPVAIFLRHRLGRQFSRHASGTSERAGQVTAELSISQDLLGAASTLEARYASLGIEFPGRALIEEERRRQERLLSFLDETLLEEAEDER